MKAYISCPILVPVSNLTEVGVKLSEKGYSPLWWIRGTDYTDAKLREADIFILMSTNSKFDYCLDDMTFVCRKELELAQSLNKPLYMTYWKKTGLHIYPINLNHLKNGRVLGQSGIYLSNTIKIIDNYSIY